MNLRQFIQMNMNRCEETLIAMHSTTKDFLDQTSSDAGYNGLDSADIQSLKQDFMALSGVIINCTTWLKFQEGHVQGQVEHKEANQKLTVTLEELNALFDEEKMQKLTEQHRQTIANVKEFSSNIINFSGSENNAPRKQMRVKISQRPTP